MSAPHKKKSPVIARAKKKKGHTAPSFCSGSTMCGNSAGMYDCRISLLSPDTFSRMRICTSPSCRASLPCFEFCPSHLRVESVSEALFFAGMR